MRSSTPLKAPLRQYTVWAGRVRNCITEAAGAVSYTHLDVYKRQEKEKRLKQEEEKIKESDRTLIHEKVTEAEIASIVSRWTGISPDFGWRGIWMEWMVSY